MEAVIFLTSVTFVIAVGATIAQGITFYRRYRVHLHVESKGMTPPQSVDLERLNHEESTQSTPLQPPPKLYNHSRFGSRNSRFSSRAMVDSQFVPYRIPEETDTGTIQHFPYSQHPNLPATFLAPVTPATSPLPATSAIQPEAPAVNHM